MGRLVFTFFLLVVTMRGMAVEIIAHRGSSDDAPENTLAAARLAWERGADGVELDVRLTKDGQLVVIHDPEVKRTTGGRGVVGKMTLGELQALDAGSWKDVKFRGERLPTLEEMLATVVEAKGKSGGGKFFVELKGGVEMVPALKNALARAGLKGDQVVIIAFDLAAVAAVKRELPQHRALWLVDYKWETPKLEKVLALAKEAGADGVNLSKKWPIDAALVGKARAAGLSVSVWTVDDAGEAKRFREAGVEAITTNRPGVLIAEFGGRK